MGFGSVSGVFFGSRLRSGFFDPAQLVRRSIFDPLEAILWLFELWISLLFREDRDFF